MSQTTPLEKQRHTILIVEDDQDIRETLMSVLEDEGYAVLGAANGQVGLEVLAKGDRPCMILLDLMMPVMSGAEFLSKMRKDDWLAPIPVIVVSAWPKEARGISGVQGFVKKPVDLRLLLELAEKFCT